MIFLLIASMVSGKYQPNKLITGGRISFKVVIAKKLIYKRRNKHVFSNGTPNFWEEHGRQRELSCVEDNIIVVKIKAVVVGFLKTISCKYSFI